MGSEEMEILAKSVVQGADEIAELRAENARLRESLAEIVRECGETDPSYDIARKALIPVDAILDAALASSRLDAENEAALSTGRDCQNASKESIGRKI